MTYIPAPGDPPNDCPCCVPPVGEQCDLPASTVNSLAGRTLGGIVSPSYSHNSYFRDDVGSYPHPVYADWDECDSTPPKPARSHYNWWTVAHWLDTLRDALNQASLVVCECEVLGPLSTRYDYCGVVPTDTYLSPRGQICPPAANEWQYAIAGDWMNNIQEWRLCVRNDNVHEVRVYVSVINFGQGNEAYQVEVQSARVTQQYIGECTGASAASWLLGGGYLGSDVVAVGSGGGGYHISGGDIYNNVGTAPTFQTIGTFLTNGYPDPDALESAILNWMNQRAGLARFSTTNLSFGSDRWIDAVDWTLSGFDMLPYTP